jgi:hypothetical protein
MKFSPKKLLKNIKKIFFYIYQRKFVLTLPKDADVVILDPLSSERLFKLVNSKHKVFVLKIEDEVYIKCLFKSLFGRAKSIYPGVKKISVNYYLEIIKEISPKLILTNIDNEPIYWNLDVILSSKMKFITIQNGTHLLGKTNTVPTRYKSRFLAHPPFYSILACLSKFDYDFYIRFGGTVNNHFEIGSLLISSYLESYIPVKKKYDICIIANSSFEGIGEKTMLDYVLKYVDSNTVNACIALKGDEIPSYLEDRLLEFSQVHKPKRIELIKKVGFSSHKASDASKVTIGHGTTLLRQTFSRGNKIYPLNFIEDSLSPPFDVLGYNLSPKYDEFEFHLDSLLELESSVYLKENKNKMCYLDTFNLDLPPEKILKGIIKDELNS